MVARTGIYTALSEKFQAISTPECFGFVRTDKLNSLDELCAKLSEDSHAPMPRAGWRQGETYVKTLGDDEMLQVPSERFQNALIMWLLRNRCCYSESTGIVIPQGILYFGKPADFLVQRTPGYFLSDFVEGETMMHVMDELSAIQKKKIVSGINSTLRNMAEKGAYPMDFAPRDIILSRNKKRLTPVIVDTEHVLYGTPDSKDFLEKQKKQFIDDYGNNGIGLTNNELEEFERLMFSGRIK